MQRPIIVFDSGKGGQSIFLPLTQALPDRQIIYLDDHENFPYGDKSEDWLKRRFTELAKKFESYNPCLVVLACNTGTVNAIEVLRELLSCPVVGVEPVIKPLAHYKHALALMTSASAKSPKTISLLQAYGPHVQVFVPSGLAQAIEFNNNDQVKKSIHEIKEIVQKNQIEAVGLSCTHYPLILAEFVAAMPEVKFIDPSGPVVQEILRVLRLNEHE